MKYNNQNLVIIMYKTLFFLVLILLCSTLTLIAEQAMQDVVYLKDGSIIRGKIIEKIPDVSLKIQTRDCSVFFYNMDKVLKITKEPIIVKDQSKVIKKKSPSLAFMLSFIFPGIGQYYNGDAEKGLLQELLFLGGWTLTATAGFNTYALENGRYHTDTTVWCWVGLGIAYGSVIWSWIDAPLSAIKINKENEQYYGHLLQFNRGNNVVGFDFFSTGKNLTASLSYHF